MNCPVTLTGIETACGTNMAGVKEVWLGNFDSFTFTYNYQLKPDYVPTPGQEPTDADYVKDIDGNKIKKSIKTATLKDGAKVMTHFAFRKQTASATSTLTVNDNGTNFWENTVNMVFAKQDQEKRLAVSSICAGQTSALVRDNNGLVTFYGLENEMTMTDGSVETGVSYSDNNAYTITIGTSETILPLPVETEAFNVMAGVTA